MYKGISDTHADEILSDNTAYQKCKQCKDCKFWGVTSNAFENAFDKTNCRKYQYPDFKPLGIIHNREQCKYKEEK